MSAIKCRWQKSAFYLALLFFIGTMVMLAVRIYETQRQPLLTCSEPVFDFGAVKQKDNPVHEFIVSVQSRRPVLIQQVKPGCGSFVEVIDFPKHPIRKGQPEKIVLRLRTELLIGKKENVAVIYSDDSVRPVFVLRLKADVQIPPERRGVPVLAPPIP